MARLFDDGANQYMVATAAAATAMPLTMACWGRGDDATIGGYAIGLGNSASAFTLYGINWAGHLGGDPIAAVYRGAGNPLAVASTTAGFTANVWHHGCAVFTNANSRHVLIDGGNKGVDATACVAPGTPNRTAIGALVTSVVAGYFSGRIAEVGIWNVALTDAEAAILAAGFAPPFVRPANLVGYWPVIGRTSPEIDPVGGQEMTLVNAPTTADHPRIIYPGPPVLALVSGAALAWPAFSALDHSPAYGGLGVR